MTPPRSKIQITFADVVEPAPPAPEMGLRGPWWAWGALLVIISVASFFPVLFGTFLPQDDLNITENPFLRSWGGLWGVWRFAYNLPQVSPLGYSLFMVEYRIWGSVARHAAGGYHLVSLLLHAGNVLLLWTLLRKLDLPGALAAAAIFAAHPVQTQTVGWISQQPTLLGTMLALNSLIVYLRFTGVNPAPFEPAILRLPQMQWLLYLIALLTFVLAILAKPMLAVLPLVVLVIIWWERGKITRGDLLALMPMLLLSIATFIGGVLVFRHRTDIAEQQIGAMQRVLTIGPATFFYLYELIRPGNFSFVYERWNLPAWSQAAMLIVIACAIASLWIMRAKIGRSPLATALLFLLLLLPQILFLDIVQLRNAFVADSAMYLPAMVMIVPITALIAGLLSHGQDLSPRTAPPWIATAAVVLLSGLSIDLASDYRSAERLWQSAIAHTPNSVYALNQLGTLELAMQKQPAALAHFLRALQIDPNSAESHRNLGAYFEAVPDPDRAFGEYFVVVSKHPDDITARCGLARTLAAQGNRAQAIQEYQTVLKYRPEYEVALNDLAGIYIDLGQYELAADCFHRAMRSAPSYLAPRINMAMLYFRLGDFQKSVDELAAAQKADPNNFVVYVNIGAICGELSQKTGNPNERKLLLRQSELAFRQALFLNSDSAQAAHNLAIALMRQVDLDPTFAGKANEAIFYFDKACRLDPDNEDFRQHLESARQQAARTAS